MRRIVLSAVSCLTISLLTGCTGDDTEVPQPDSGTTTPPVGDAGSDSTLPGDAGDDGGAPEASAEDAPGDSNVVDAADAAPLTPYLLTSYYYGGGYSNTEYSAFDLTTNQTAGGLSYASYGINQSTNTAPWVLEQANDLVLRMDPTAPWKPTSSWTVPEPKPSAGESTNSDPFSVAEVGNKAYVALYARDYIAVLDTSAVADGGAPTKSISLTQFVSDADIDQNLEAIALAYDATRQRVWVVLGNGNNGAIPANGAYTPCSAGFHPLVVAIDTTTDTIVPNVAYPLTGYDIYPASAVAYDATGDRLLIASGGCEDVTNLSDGGVTVGPTIDSVVETIALANGTDTVLLNPAPQYTSALVYVDSHHAFLESGNGTNAWDPTSPVLGALVANAPDTSVWDGKGHLLGPQTTSLSDGGSSYAIVSVDPTDGGLTTLATGPFSPLPTSYGWQAIDLWPRP